MEVFSAIVLTGAVLCIVGCGYYVGRRERKRAERGIVLTLTGGKRTLPFSGGIASVTAPVSFRHQWSDKGELVLSKPEAPGVFVLLRAALISVEHAEDDPAFRYVESWADDRSTDVQFVGDRCVAAWDGTIERESEDLQVHEWLMAINGALASCVVEVQSRIARSGPTKKVLSDVRSMLQSIHIRLHRDVLTINDTTLDVVQLDGETVGLLDVDNHDRQRLQRWNERATELLKQYLSSERAAVVTPEHLDATLFLLRRSRDGNQPDDNTVIHALGAGLGEYLIRKGGLQWRVCPLDGQRTFVVHDPATGVVASPFRMITDHAIDGLSDPCAACASAVLQVINNRQRHEQTP